jgi:hypothetical protein
MINMLNLLGFAILSFTAHAEKLDGIVFENPELKTPYTAECQAAIDERKRSIVDQHHADFMNRYKAVFQHLSPESQEKIKKLEEERTRLNKRTAELFTLIKGLQGNPANTIQVNKFNEEIDSNGTRLADILGEISGHLFDYIRRKKDHIFAVLDQAEREGAKMTIRESGVTYERILNGDGNKSLRLGFYKDAASNTEDSKFAVRIDGQDRYLAMEKVFSQQLVECRETERGRLDASSMTPEVRDYLASLNGIAPSAPATPETQASGTVAAE